MHEECEFRVNAEFAHLLFAPEEGEDLGSVIKVRLAVTDRRFGDVGRLDRECDLKYGKAFFYGWKYYRH